LFSENLNSLFNLKVVEVKIHDRVAVIFKAFEADFYSWIHLQKSGNYCFNSLIIINSQHPTRQDFEEFDSVAATAGAIAFMTAAIHS
jgi:hypothetical protein